MRRRRRRGAQEIAFSFDSFLDVVANVVGIILRLILVAWAGARTYQATLPPPPPAPPAYGDPEPLPEPTDPRSGLLVRRRERLEQDAAALRGKDAEGRQVAGVGRQLRDDLAALAARQGKLSEEETARRSRAQEQAKAAQLASLSLAELQARSKRLTEEMDALKKAGPPRKELRYRTPVSAPVSEELMFECKGGRVTLIDTGAMLAEVKRETRAKAEELRKKWQVTELTAPVGAFRLRYVIERERGALEDKGEPTEGGFRYGVASWEVVPVAAERGEPAAAALASGSAFRKVVDALDPRETAVTLWVYPDSFELYRGLRDYLHDRDVVVAGRPLMDGIPIASSRQGTASRGQ